VDAAVLKTTLDGWYAAYHDPSYLRYDPLEFVRRMRGRENREIAGLMFSSIAYGRVEQIRASIRNILAVTGAELFRFAVDTPLAKKVRLFAGVKHRFNTGTDFAVLLECAARAQLRYGSLETLFCEGLRQSHPTVEQALDVFALHLRAQAAKTRGARSRYFDFLLPSPSSGSACKRLTLFLRWMVRPDDGIDLGEWKRVSASQLVMPVDTHVAAVSRSLGITSRRTADWAMSREITSVMRTVCPHDPVKYDFSLCRTGMIDFRNITAAA
jgi:uncharacterized protein (TIGR02757 family)